MAPTQSVEELTEDYGKQLAAMRQTFASGRSRSVEWRKQQLSQLLKMYEENHELISNTIAADMGGTKMRGMPEIAAAQGVDEALANIDCWTRERWVEGWIHRLCVRPEPKGVVLIIAPWNVPWQLLVRPLASAIAAGNLAVLKPSELNPQSSPLIAKLIPQYLDPDCFRVIEGAVPETTALLNNRWDHIFYTGNAAVGRVVMAAAAKHLTPVTMELGGKSPVLVDETAKMDVTCRRIAFAKWMLCGQICVAPDYVLVHRSKEAEFIERMVKLAKDGYGEDGTQQADFGRIVNERHAERLEKLIKTCGGEVVHGGFEGIQKSEGFVPPTIIKQPSMDAPIMKEEIFGPVLPVIPYDNLEDALEIIKKQEIPLAFYVFSESSRNVEKALTAIQSGGAGVNTVFEQVVPESIPFGGLGESGFGMYHGKYGFDEFSHQRAIVRKSTLPGFQGTLFPLPKAGEALPEFVYPLVVRLQLGIFPQSMKSCWRGLFHMLMSPFRTLAGR
ncbi:Aldh3a1 [Symbiodinium natans]|uniref:Aldehyde dehydrogenase n=1 Tax=Symbiodinium natans TaxID=878477 RepID=A0A812R6B9_9DINO|nr:Aldh3a1 [Symbiodinium natans]